MKTLITGLFISAVTSALLVSMSASANDETLLKNTISQLNQQNISAVNKAVANDLSKDIQASLSAMITPMNTMYSKQEKQLYIVKQTSTSTAKTTSEE